MRAILSMILICSPSVVSRGDAADKDELQGKWTLITAETGDGQRDGGFLGRTAAIVGDQIEFFKPDGQSEGTWTFVINAQKKPKAIDFHAERRGKKITLLGIYALEGARLRLCWSLKPNGTRPVEFAPVANSDERRVFVLDRQKQ